MCMRPPTIYNRYRILPGQVACVDDETLFAATARCVGDRAAAVLATSAALAPAAARLVQVAYAVLPSALHADAALAEGAMPIHAQGNLLHAFDHQSAPAENIDPAAEATQGQTTVRTQMLHHAAIERPMCLASCDATGKLTIRSPCQSVCGARTVVDARGHAAGPRRVCQQFARPQPDKPFREAPPCKISIHAASGWRRGCLAQL